MADVTEMSLRNRGLAFGQGGYPRHQFSDYYYILCANCQYSQSPQWMWSNVAWETPTSCRECGLAFAESLKRNGMKLWTEELELQRRILDLRKLLSELRLELQEMECRMMTLRSCYHGIEETIVGLENLRQRFNV